MVATALLSEAAALWFDAGVIIHGPLNPLLAAEIPFGCLHGNVAQKELNLLQFAACGMEQLCARAAKIMWSEPRKTLERSMRDFIDAAVDGIIPGDIGELVRVVSGRLDVRLATRQDNPFVTLNEAYGLKIRTGDDGTMPISHLHSKVPWEHRA
jgi:hypothetical protein